MKQFTLVPHISMHNHEIISNSEMNSLHRAIIKCALGRLESDFENAACWGLELPCNMEFIDDSNPTVKLTVDDDSYFFDDEYRHKNIYEGDFVTFLNVIHYYMEDIGCAVDLGLQQ